MKADSLHCIQLLCLLNISLYSCKVRGKFSLVTVRNLMCPLIKAFLAKSSLMRTCVTKCSPKRNGKTDFQGEVPAHLSADASYTACQFQTQEEIEMSPNSFTTSQGRFLKPFPRWSLAILSFICHWWLLFSISKSAWQVPNCFHWQVFISGLKWVREANSINCLQLKCLCTNSANICQLTGQSVHYRETAIVLRQLWRTKTSSMSNRLCSSKIRIL